MYCLGLPPMDGPDYEKAEELRKYGMALYEHYRWGSLDQFFSACTVAASEGSV